MPSITVTVEYEADFNEYIYKEDVENYLPDVVNIDNLKKVTKIKINNIKNKKLGKTIFREEG